jgi:hypothetical protein
MENFMQEDTKLPDYNPENTCPKCGKKLPTWQLFFDSTEKKEKVGHNFCPAIGEDGQIVNLCLDCKIFDGPKRSCSIFGVKKDNGSRLIL